MSCSIHTGNVNNSILEAEPEAKKTKLIHPKRSYICKSILEIPAHIDCLISKMSLEQIEAKGEFPDLKDIVGKVKALKFDELEGGPVELAEHISCKLYYLDAQKIVLIKAPSKVVLDNSKLTKQRPLEHLEGSQRKLRPLIGVTQSGQILDLIQLSSNTEASEQIDGAQIQKRIDFEEKFYSSFPKDHHTTPLPTTLCLLRETENKTQEQIGKFKLIQKRESADLMQFLKNTPDLDFGDALRIARDLVHALYICQNEMGIVVADIKTPNVLINVEEMKGRLCDFGLSYFLEGSNLDSGFAGTPYLFPPEYIIAYLKKSQFDRDFKAHPEVKEKVFFARDVWDIGCLFSHLLFHKKVQCIYYPKAGNEDYDLFWNFFNKLMNADPINNDDFNQFFRRSKNPPFSPQQISDITSIDDRYKEVRKEVLDLVTQMFSLDIRKRPTAEALMNQFDVWVKNL
jgi:serine/threonine protein kinase